MASYVEAHLQFELREPADLLVQIAVAAGTPVRSESCQFSREGKVYVPREVVGRHGTRVMRVQAGVGLHDIVYSASVAGSRSIDAVDELDLIEYCRPSRYVESDLLRGLALSQFAGLRGRCAGMDVVRLAVCTWCELGNVQCVDRARVWGRSVPWFRARCCRDASGK